MLCLVPWDTMYLFDLFYTILEECLNYFLSLGRFVVRILKGPHHGSQRISLILLR